MASTDVVRLRRPERRTIDAEAFGPASQEAVMWLHVTIVALLAVLFVARVIWVLRHR